MTSVPEPRVGEVRRSIGLGLDMECVGLAPTGEARCRLALNPSRVEDVPAEIWAEYPLVEASRG